MSVCADQTSQDNSRVESTQRVLPESTSRALRENSERTHIAFSREHKDRNKRALRAFEG